MSSPLPTQSHSQIDTFDLLPDSILLLIFNLIRDVKSLGRCCAVSRRFHSLVPLIDNAIVNVDCVVSEHPSLSSSNSSPDKSRGVFSHFVRLVFGGIVRPFHALGEILSVKRVSALNSAGFSSEVSHHSPSEVLRKFKEIRRLRIVLPAGELGVDEGVLLKWKADFGSSLDSCVILGAASVFSSDSSLTQEICVGEDNGSIPESFYVNGGLKLRVVWTISSLIAASARHYLLQPIITEHERLECLDLVDADGQGVLSMDRWQLEDLRVRPVCASGSSQRTLVPALSMRLWYAPLIEIPGGLVLKGATLVAIRPSEELQKEAGGEGLDLAWVSNALEEPYGTAAKMLMKRRTYCLEMNSF